MDSLRKELLNENPKTLLDRLESAMEQGEIDADEVSVYLDVLDQTAPLDVPARNSQESLQEFREKYAITLDSDRKARRVHPVRRKILRTALAACLCVVMMFAVAQAYGVNLIAQFLEWREETFVLHASNSGGQMTLEQAPEGEYVSMAAALADYGITEPVAPTWIPEGFAIKYARVKELYYAANFNARYEAGDRVIALKVYRGPDGDESDVHAELSDPSAEKYEAGGITFLISKNNAQYRAAWLTGDCTCNLSGDLTERQLKKMLDSISAEER